MSRPRGVLQNPGGELKRDLTPKGTERPTGTSCGALAKQSLGEALSWAAQCPSPQSPIERCAEPQDAQPPATPGPAPAAIPWQGVVARDHYTDARAPTQRWGRERNALLALALLNASIQARGLDWHVVAEMLQSDAPEVRRRALMLGFGPVPDTAFV